MNTTGVSQMSDVADDFHRLQKAELLIERQRSSLARRLLLEVIADDPDNITARDLLSRIAFQDQSYAECRTWAKEILVISPLNSEAMVLYGFAVLHDDQLVLPRDVPCYQFEGPGYHRRLRLAERYARQALAIAPFEACAFELLAQVAVVRKKYSKGLLFAKQAMAVNPESQSAALVKSLCLQRLGRKREAGETEEQALRFDPMSDVIHSRISERALDESDFEVAVEHARLALQLDPSNERFQERYFRTLRAQSSVLTRLVLQIELKLARFRRLPVIWHCLWTGSLACAFFICESLLFPDATPNRPRTLHYFMFIGLYVYFPVGIAESGNLLLCRQGTIHEERFSKKSGWLLAVMCPPFIFGMLAIQSTTDAAWPSVVLTVTLIAGAGLVDFIDGRG